MRLANPDELARWDALVEANPDGGNVLQTLAWGDFKSRWGWQPRRYVYELADGRTVVAQWLTRKVGLGQTIWYCPKGPGVTELGEFAEVVRQTKAAGLGGIFTRFEPEVVEWQGVPGEDYSGGGAAHQLAQLGLVKANRDPGSKATVFVDLSQGEEAVLASFSKSARRNFRKAETVGVAVELAQASPANLETMFDLMRATDNRAHYGLRPRAYFLDYWSSQMKAGQAQLLFARHDGEVLAGMFVTFLGKRAWYKDGGSFDKKRDLQASYAVQWSVMRWLMARGVHSYDLMGVPSRATLGTGDSRDSLYEFKRKFNPVITEFIGAWDAPGNATAYKTWLRAGERVAARLANRRPERFLY